MANPDLDLGPCQVLFGTYPNEVDIGETQGGVRVAFGTPTAPLLTDQYGTEPQDEVITGMSAQVTVPLAEYTLNRLALALNQDVTTYDAEHGIQGERLVGTKLSSFAQSLTLKKYVDGVVSTDEEDWMRFPSAAPIGNFEISFDGSSQRIIEVIFKAFPDDDDILYYLGDQDAAESGT